MLPPLLVVAIVSVAAMVWAVGKGDQATSLAAALAPGLVLVTTSIFTNLAMSTGNQARMGDAMARAAKQNAQLLALVYGWGGVAILGVYTLTNMWWWHSWQYGLAMVFVSMCLFSYAGLLGRDKSIVKSLPALDVTAYLAAAQILAAIAALIFLVVSGKFGRPGQDWPANQIFVVGGVSLIFVSLMAVLTHWRLRATIATSRSPSS